MIVSHVQTPLVFVQPLASVLGPSAANVAKPSGFPQKAVTQVRKTAMVPVQDSIQAKKDSLTVSQDVQNRLKVAAHSVDTTPLPSGSVRVVQNPPSSQNAAPGDLIGALLTSFV